MVATQDLAGFLVECLTAPVGVELPQGPGQTVVLPQEHSVQRCQANVLINTEITCAQPADGEMVVRKLLEMKHAMKGRRAIEEYGKQYIREKKAARKKCVNNYPPQNRVLPQQWYHW